MKPQTSPPAILIETAHEADILGSYFTGDQPPSFQKEDLAERRERLIQELNEGRDLGKLPVAVSVDDVRELVVPAVDLALDELDGLWFASKEIADYRADVMGYLGCLAA